MDRTELRRMEEQRTEKEAMINLENDHLADYFKHYADWYISVRTLLRYCANQKDLSLSPNDFMRMSWTRMREWIPCEKRKPDNQYDDWVLGQIRETDSGYLWIPKVVEYSERKDDWYEDSIGWMKGNPDHAFEVIAWMPLPAKYRK